MNKRKTCIDYFGL